VGLESEGQSYKPRGERQPFSVFQEIIVDPMYYDAAFYFPLPWTLIDEKALRFLWRTEASSGKQWTARQN